MRTPGSIEKLVERFKENYDACKALTYNETQVRRELIDPLFKALGWDIDNTKGIAEKWKEVVHEDSLKVGDDTCAPDYSFRLGGRRLFFLEAKKQWKMEWLQTANKPHDKTLLQRQITATDREMDQLVYTLYGLTEEEIRIVEKG